MQYIIEVNDEKDLEKLKASGVDFHVAGSEKDMFLKCCFGKADIAEMLDWKIEDGEFTSTEKKFVKHLQKDQKAYDAIVDGAFKLAIKNYDANNGITNDSLVSDINIVFKEQMMKYLRTPTK